MLGPIMAAAFFRPAYLFDKFELSSPNEQRLMSLEEVRRTDNEASNAPFLADSSQCRTWSPVTTVRAIIWFTGVL